MNAPRLREPLGSYPDREEYQVGRTLVWLEIPPGSNRSSAIAKGHLLFPTIWNAVPQAISAAETASRIDIPEFWNAHDNAGTSGKQLSVWGIWINPQTESAEYEVNLNHEFYREAHPGLPEFPDGMSLMVHRNVSGVCNVRIVR